MNLIVMRRLIETRRQLERYAAARRAEVIRAQLRAMRGTYAS